MVAYALTYLLICMAMTFFLSLAIACLSAILASTNLFWIHSIGVIGGIWGLRYSFLAYLIVDQDAKLANQDAEYLQDKIDEINCLLDLLETEESSTVCLTDEFTYNGLSSMTIQPNNFSRSIQDLKLSFF